jgi:hypothetical protein
MLAIVALLAFPGSAAGAGGPVPAVRGGVGASAPDASVTYVALAARHGTVVARVRKHDGSVERSRWLRGRLGVPGAAWDGSTTGLSADGRTLVLAEMSDRYPARRTHLLVLDASTLRVDYAVSLRGAFTVDAISPSGRWLYLIHYRSPDDPLRYEVRAYDLERRRLVRAPVIDPREPDEKMAGTAVSRIPSSDGRWAYTLYVRADDVPFIHALDTAKRTAACIDLDGVSGADGGDMKLAVDGRSLRVEGGGETVALVDTRTFAVRPPSVAPAVRRPVERETGGGLPWLLIAIPLAAAALVVTRFAVRARGRPGAAGRPRRGGRPWPRASRR